MYLLPHHLISGFAYRLTRCRWVPLKNFLIKSFIALFNVDMSLAQEPEVTAYPTFNHFFTRALRPEVRPLAPNPDAIVCPVDGAISQIGKITGAEIFQAKNRYYNLQSLLTGDEEMVAAFQDGLFITLYLSPRDYHRIHMPINGGLKKMIHVPGRLFPVNRQSVRTVDRLFARNERIINYFNTESGPMALIMVGAINVGSMETVWAGEVIPADKGKISTTSYNESNIKLARGAEMGRFNMGSTVILLFSKNALQWNPELVPDSPVEMGLALGK